jgi:hypothetical protein
MTTPFNISVRNTLFTAAFLLPLNLSFSVPYARAQGPTGPAATDHFISLVETDPTLDRDPNLSRSRLSLDTAHHTINLDVSPAPYSVVLGARDPLNIPTEATIRLRFLKRDISKASLFTPPVQEAFTQIHTEIANCTHKGLTPTSTIESAAKTTECASIEAGFAHLSNVVIDQAHTKGFIVTHSKAVSAPYRIDLKFVPARYPFRYMTALEYWKCEKLKESKDQYFVESHSEYELLVGRYYYQIDWPKSLGGTEGGFITVDASKALTFAPKSQ